VEKKISLVFKDNFAKLKDPRIDRKKVTIQRYSKNRHCERFFAKQSRNIYGLPRLINSIRLAMTEIVLNSYEKSCIL